MLCDPISGYLTYLAYLAYSIGIREEPSIFWGWTSNTLPSTVSSRLYSFHYHRFSQNDRHECRRYARIFDGWYGDAGVSSLPYCQWLLWLTSAIVLHSFGGFTTINVSGICATTRLLQCRDFGVYQCDISRKFDRNPDELVDITKEDFYARKKIVKTVDRWSKGRGKFEQYTPILWSYEVCNSTTCAWGSRKILT